MGRQKDIDVLVKDLVFIDDLDTKQKISAEIVATAKSRGIYLSSIHELYRARSRGEATGFTVPVINLRGMTYDLARAIFRVVQKINAGAFIFGLSKTESHYTAQSPAEYAGAILAAAIKEDYSGPVFLQMNHLQVKDRMFFIDSDREINLVKQLIEEAINAGFYNIELDCSTLLDISKLSQKDQQKDNCEISGKLIQFIREIQPEGVTISIGANVGEIQGRNSTPEEIKVFMEGCLQSLPPGLTGIDNVEVCVGACQGTATLADGTLMQVRVDFDLLKSLTEMLRSEYSMAGVVHEAGVNLPTGIFHKFVESGTLEVHFAAYFQNLIFDSTIFPKELKERMYSWVKRNCLDDRRENQTEDQFIYRTRKKAFGAFKKEVAALPAELKEGIAREVEAKFDFLFKQLKIGETKTVVATHIKPVDVKPGDRRLAGV